MSIRTNEITPGFKTETTQGTVNLKRIKFFFKASKSMRVWFAFMGSLLWIGIYITGFSIVNWLIYVPAAGFAFAAITGICPSQIGIFKMVDKK